MGLPDAHDPTGAGRRQGVPGSLAGMSPNPDELPFDVDAVAASLPTDQPERAAEGLRALMEHPGFRQLVQQVQAGELGDDELREEATSIAHDLAARQELRRDEP